MLRVIDNYDSFTYNLVQYLGELGQDVRVVRNDGIAAADVAGLAPSHIVISPGPCTPNEAGISLDVIKMYAGKIPILGVCLGHQSIGQAFGGKIVRAARVMHGKTSPIHHDGKGVFAGLPNPFEARATTAADRAPGVHDRPGGHGADGGGRDRCVATRRFRPGRAVPSNRSDHMAGLLANFIARRTAVKARSPRPAGDPEALARIVDRRDRRLTRWPASSAGSWTARHARADRRAARGDAREE
jgi:GMP synthase-like glutamine amidotransferase